MKRIAAALVAALALMALSGCLAATKANGMAVTMDGETTVINPEVSEPPPVIGLDDEPERIDSQIGSTDRSISDSPDGATAAP